jgi:hypothetical protein|eukprot:1003155-Prymnesium_polylepis.1
MDGWIKASTYILGSVSTDGAGNQINRSTIPYLKTSSLSKQGQNGQVTAFGNSMGAMGCYVTVQESGKHLTLVAELPPIVQVMKWTVLLSVA